MSELTLGGYMAKHDRAAAFGGSDGQAYSVAIYVDEEPDVRGLYGAALLFVRWSPSGDRPVGHVEPWQPGGSGWLDGSIGATRRAVFPLLGLDPDDPRD